MKKNYEKPVLNASMTGTLEGVYAAYGTTCSTTDQISSTASGNDEEPTEVPASGMTPATPRGRKRHWNAGCVRCWHEGEHYGYHVGILTGRVW